MDSQTAVGTAEVPDSLIVRLAPDAIIFADSAGLIRLWNLSAESLFGFAAAEVVGSSLDVIIPERLRGPHWQGFHTAIGTGVTKYAGRVLTTRSVHKDGRQLYVDLSFALLRDGGGAVTGALAIARDCTQRYLSEKALHARVLELEKQLQTAFKPP
jgi:PAS domain S-box-containing protein